MNEQTASYRELLDSGRLAERVAQTQDLMRECRICPRNCGVNRAEGETGVCGVDARVMVSSAGPHYGEEPPLVGWGGSGTIFFSGCNLKCIFCQNYTISWEKEGRAVSIPELAGMMLALQQHGCHNVNFVTPTHYVPQILAATYHAAKTGLRVPIVYNTGGYDSLGTLRLLEGVVDIYMPDLKYSIPQVAKELSGAPDYPDRAYAALREMHRQVGDLILDHRGIAVRGLLVRHLVLPNDLAGTEAILRFLAKEISAHTYVNIMDQYRPEYRAHEVPSLSRRIRSSEYREALETGRRYGLHRGF